MPFDGPVNFTITKQFQPLLVRHNYRYKGFYGGRGSMKSQSIAKCLVALAHTQKLLILCTREFQNSIADSVHRELVRQIEVMGLLPWFDVQKSTIISKVTGAQFIFKGLHYSIGEIKSMTGVDICWVEEAQSITKDSLLILDPTLREMGSEIWFSFNPEDEKDPIYDFLVKNPPPNAYVSFVNWKDNLWFPKVLEDQRQRMLLVDPDNYDWVWEGQTRKNAAASIFRKKYYVEHFAEPDPKTRFFHGADWGFSQDPTCLIRCFIVPVSPGVDDLYVDQETYGYQTDLDAIPALFDKIETARIWPIIADNARPETISYVGRKGFNIRAAEKWQGSVEDGVSHLRAFRKIIVHPRCENIIQEFRLYSYKVDPKTNDVLPQIVDKWNHGIDACIEEGQLVDTARGQVPIEQVIVGDLVQTRKGVKPVYAVRMSGVKPILKLIAGDKELFATGDHRIMLANGGVARLDSLRYGDEVLVHKETSCPVPLLNVQTLVNQRDGARPVSITKSESAPNAETLTSATSTKKSVFVPTPVKCVEDTGRTARTYDLSVEDQPEFVASGILVHNCRYALDGYIQKRGGHGVWSKLAQPQ